VGQRQLLAEEDAQFESDRVSDDAATRDPGELHQSPQFRHLRLHRELGVWRRIMLEHR
jgi:hypothetical protein